MSSGKDEVTALELRPKPRNSNRALIAPRVDTPKVAGIIVARGLSKSCNMPNTARSVRLRGEFQQNPPNCPYIA